MTPPPADKPNPLPKSLDRLEDEPMADWVARLREDMQARARSGPVPRVEEYLRSFSILADDRESILDLIAMERLLRREAGEDIPSGFFFERFPDLRAELEQQLDFDLALDMHLAEDAPPEGDDLDGFVPRVSGPDSPAPPEPPPLPDRFRPIRMLGRGGFGEAWLCHDAKHGRRVAIKVLHKDVGRGGVSDRFRREAVMAAKVSSHPNVCVIYDSELDHRPPYLVLEYVDGETLRDILNAGSPMEIDEAVRIARDVADGCRAFHARGIVHRDLKPENIKRDRKGLVKILDFGLARPFDPAAHRITSDDRIIGTIAYLSPEQTLAGKVPIGPPSDQFSLGVVLYEMLAGRAPFSVENDHGGLATVLRIQECRPEPLREIRPEIDEALQSIVLRMLQPRAGDRFQSMHQVVFELDAYREGNRRPVSLPGPRWTRRAAMIGALLCLIAGMIGFARSVWPTAPKATRVESTLDLLTLIRDDLDRQVDSDDRPFQRYFTLTNLANDEGAGPRVLQRYRDALTRLLAALSPGAPVSPRPIDGGRMVLRVDLRALGWADEPFRREIHRHNPYALQFPTDSTEDRLRNVAHDVERRLGEVDSHYPACIRVDWFVATFSDPRRARGLLGLADASPEEIEGRLARISAMRSEWADLLELYERPVDLATAARELGVADEPAVHQAVLQLPPWADDLLGLRPLTEGGTVPREVWAFSDVAYTTFGQVCQQLRLGRRLLVR